VHPHQEHLAVILPAAPRGRLAISIPADWPIREAGLPIVDWPSSPSIVDDVRDLLEPLPLTRRWGLIAYLSVRYYDGWRPDRDEIADIVAIELGRVNLED